jgi:di/tricarboxylate transporter
VHEELKESGYSGFGFFSFSLVGLGVLVVAVVYVLLIGRHLLSGATPVASTNKTARSARQVWQDFNLEETVQILRVEEGSPLAGTSLVEAGLHADYQLRILGVRERDASRKEALLEPTSSTVIHSGEELIVAASPENAARLGEEKGLSVVPLAKRNDRQQLMREIGIATVLVHPDSDLKDKSLREANFRSRFGLHVIGLRRQQKSVQDFEDSRIEASDTLLVFGPWSRIEQLKERTHDFIMLELPSEHADVVPASRRMPVALAILVAMVLLTASNVVPLVAAVIMAVMAAVATRCLTMDDSYRAVHWNSLVLVAGMLPLADALVATGGSELIVNTLMSTVGTWGPHAMFTTLFFLTAGLGLVLSNTASAVLVAPIAITAANQLEVSPYPFAIAVLIAASAAFVTPISTPVVTLVVAPGRYKFFDFVKVGVPLLLLTYVVTILLAPLVFPY